MSRFIFTHVGEINTDCIVSARVRHTKNPHDRGYTEITYIVGKEILTTQTYGPVNLCEEVAPIIPAHPGYAVVELRCDPPYDVVATPVIAWRIESNYVHPICAGEGFTNEGRWGILDPSGRVDIPFGDCARYLSVAEFQREESKKLIAAAHVMTEKAAGFTFLQMLAAGWTVEALIQHGYARAS